MRKDRKKKHKLRKIETDTLIQIRNAIHIFFVILTVIVITILQTKESVLLSILVWIVMIINFRITNRILFEVKEYSNQLGVTMDSIMLGYEVKEYDLFEESLLSKNQVQLKKVCDVIKKTIRESEQEKSTLQELITDISHQVKTPIANITLYLEALKKKEISSEDKKYYLEILSEQIHKLSFLMENLVKMSRLETGIILLQPEVLSIYNTLANVLRQIMFQVEKKGITITVDCSEELKIFHDSKWTGEALFNVLDNAVKYTKEGGNIRITVKKYEVYSVIEIKDNGRGIRKDELLKIFKRFYRGYNVGKESGTGIGLYLSRQIITMEKGFITVDSIENKGTVFQVYLYNQ